MRVIIWLLSNQWYKISSRFLLNIGILTIFQNFVCMNYRNKCSSTVETSSEDDRLLVEKIEKLGGNQIYWRCQFNLLFRKILEDLCLIYCVCNFLAFNGLSMELENSSSLITKIIISTVNHNYCITHIFCEAKYPC